MKSSLLPLCLALVAALPAFAAQRGEKSAPRSKELPLEFPGARTEVFKTIGEVRLRLHIFEPAGHRAEDRRPAIVFFFGGGWRSGTPGQFEHQCRYLAQRGMVAMTAEYRVLSRHGTAADKCVADGKSAIRWVREHAARLGVDPRRIAAGGGSAGGHVAACTGVVPGFEETGEKVDISAVPNALVLFNPAVVLAPVPGRASPLDERNMEGLEARMGTKPENLSPWHQVRKGQPPTLLVHGKGDTTVPFWTAEAFAEKMTAAGNRCELAGYEGQAHGFFNHGRGGNQMFAATVKRMDEFLVSLGYLSGPATVEEYLKAR